MAYHGPEQAVVVVDPRTGDALLQTASGLTPGQNALSTTAELVLAANADRNHVEITNDDAAIKVYIGDDNTVTAANGHVLKPGATIRLEGYRGAIWMIAASGTPTVTFVEW